MEKKYYVLYLNPSRPDFAMTMTDEEHNIMMQHIAYWQEHAQNGTMLVFGPVMDMSGPYGLGIIAVDSDEQLKSLIAGDPAGKINHYEYHPMRAVVSSKFHLQ